MLFLFFFLAEGFAAFLVLIGLIIALLPTMMDWDANLHPQHHKAGSNHVSSVVWPLLFTAGFLPGALMNIIQEKVLKAKSKTKTDTARVNVFYVLAFSSLYQVLALLAMFFVNVTPFYCMGYQANHDQCPGTVKSTFEDLAWGFRCFFNGEAGCGYAGLWGSVFIASYIVSYIFGGFLLRYASANFSSVASALVTPVGALFFTLFRQSAASGGIEWAPSFNKRSLFTLGSVPIIVIGVLLYQMLPTKNRK